MYLRTSGHADNDILVPEFFTMPKLTDLKHAAREAGERFFTTREPCNRGHVGRRYASTGGCVECLTGKTEKPLTNVQTHIMRKWVFPTIVDINLPESAEVALEAYLLRCMDAFHTARGLVFPFNMQKVDFMEKTGLPLADYDPSKL